MRALLLLAVLAMGSVSGRAAAAEAAKPACDAPDDAAGMTTPLPHVAEFLKRGATLQVLAVGSATMFGPETSLLPGTITSQAGEGVAPATAPAVQVFKQPASPSSFPQRMARALESAVPGLSVTITARGGRGLTATDQLHLLDDNLGRGGFGLVLWQTGTLEAVRNLPPSDFASTLADGIAKTQQAGADLILIDPQYSRFLQTNTNIEPYEQVFQQLSSVPGVALFHRFDLMRNWANDGKIDLEHTPKPERKRAVEQLHACLGEQLAHIVMMGARQ